MTTKGIRTALVLRHGPVWKSVLFTDIRNGDVFVLVERGVELDPPSIATSNAEERPYPELGVVEAEELRGISKEAVAALYSSAMATGVSHGAVVKGLLAMRDAIVMRDVTRCASIKPVTLKGYQP